MICKYFDLHTSEFIQRQEPRPGDVTRHFGDDTKFRDIFGSIPRVSIEEGIRRTIDWFKALPSTPQELLSREVARNWESEDVVR